MHHWLVTLLSVALVLPGLVGRPVAAGAPNAEPGPAVGGHALLGPAAVSLPYPPRPLLGGLSSLTPAGGEAPAGRPALQAGPPAAQRVTLQGLDDQATLETRQPEVQWSPAAAGDW